MNYDYWRQDYKGMLSKRSALILKLNDIIIGGTIITVLTLTIVAAVFKVPCLQWLLKSVGR